MKYDKITDIIPALKKSYVAGEKVLQGFKVGCLHGKKFFDYEVQAYYCPECERYIQ